MERRVRAGARVLFQKSDYPFNFRPVIVVALTAELTVHGNFALFVQQVA